MKKQQMLILAWLVVTLLSFVVNSIEQYRVPNTNDACLATCVGCDLQVPTPILVRWYCCMWDYGCWFNPFEPDYQVSICDRPLSLCLIYLGEGMWQVIECCEPAVNCSEVDGAPCCEPYNVHPCPNPYP